jgi:hypothetical protein
VIAAADSAKVKLTDKGIELHQFLGEYHSRRYSRRYHHFELSAEKLAEMWGVGGFRRMY